VGVNVTLTAQNGTIGLDSNFLEIQSSVDRFGVLNAQAPGVIRVSQTTATCTSTPSPPAVERHVREHLADELPGLDHRRLTWNRRYQRERDRRPDRPARPVRQHRRRERHERPQAGLRQRSGCTSHDTLLYQGANYQNATDAQRAVTATCDVAAQADGIFLTEVAGL
jgi:hypothetical protein